MFQNGQRYFFYFAAILSTAWSCSKGGGTTPTAPEVVALQVSSTSPAPGQDNVPINSIVEATLSFPVDPATVTTASVNVFLGGTQLAGEVRASGNRVTFIPERPLVSLLPYQATIAKTVRGAEGQQLADDFVWRFETADVAGPRLIMSTPLDGQSLVPLNSSIQLEFDDDLDPQTVNTQNIFMNLDYFSGGCPSSGDVPCTVSYQNRIITVIPNAPLLPSQTNGVQKTYFVTVSTSVRDAAGNSVPAPSCVRFTTQDTIGPTVVQAVPNAGDNMVDINVSDLFALCNEPLDPVTVTSTCLSVQDDLGTQIPGTVSYTASGMAPTFTLSTTDPFIGLLPDIPYTARLNTEIRDQYGNALLNDYVWSFRTRHDWSNPQVWDNSTGMNYPRIAFDSTRGHYQGTITKIPSGQTTSQIIGNTISRYPDRNAELNITGSVLNSGAPAMTVLPDGSAFFFWNSPITVGGTSSMFAKRRLPDGTFESQDYAIDYNGLTEGAAIDTQRPPVIAVAADGTVHAAFWQSGVTGSGWRIVANRRPPGGNWLQAPGDSIPVVDLPSGNSGAPIDFSMAVSPATAPDAGAVYVAFAESTAAGQPTKVWVSRRSPTGTWAAPVEVSRNGNPAGNASVPSVAVAPNGAAYVAFLQTLGTAPNFLNVMINRRDPTTGNWETGTNIIAIDYDGATGGLDAQDPKIVIGPNGVPHVFFRQTQPGNNVYNILSNRFENGSWLQGPNIPVVFPITGGNAYSFQPVITPNNSVSLVLVYTFGSGSTLQTCSLPWNGSSYGTWTTARRIDPAAPLPIPQPPASLTTTINSFTAATGGMGANIGVLFIQHWVLAENVPPYNSTNGDFVFFTQFR